MTKEEKIGAGKFRIGVKSSKLYKQLIAKLGDEFKSQVIQALIFNDKEMITELKNLSVSDAYTEEYSVSCAHQSSTNLY